MFLKFYSNDGQFTLLEVEAHFPLENHNGICIIYKQYLSNSKSDDLNTGKLLVARRFLTEAEEITREEFCKLVQQEMENFKALAKGDPDVVGPISIMGKLSPITFITAV